MSTGKSRVGILRRAQAHLQRALGELSSVRNQG